MAAEGPGIERLGGGGVQHPGSGAAAGQRGSEWQSHSDVGARGEQKERVTSRP
jgi:hypothetical protein